ncbi:MAG: GNAT family N-acetyltransferase [Anaerolineaceae bacterium]|nr:GNAT family N-acetyltransferase [Anaerolineaceae bacterium]
MAEQSILYTERLILRQPELSDLPVIQRLVGEREIARMTLSIPHPYPEGAAEAWITHAHEQIADGLLASFGIVRREDGVYMGTVGLRLDPEHHAAEIGYWVGKPYWNQGYTSEAARRVIQYGFEERGLHRIAASYFTHNPASARVMQKLGMQFEGILRQHVVKWGEFTDLGYYSILASEYEATR